MKICAITPMTGWFRRWSTKSAEKPVIVGDSQLELLFASFLERCDDIISYAKNYFAVNFRIDYVNGDGNISNYYPDFPVKTSPKEIYIVETKGLEDPDVPLKMERLKKWRQDINAAQNNIRFD